MRQLNYNLLAIMLHGIINLVGYILGLSILAIFNFGDPHPDLPLYGIMDEVK